MRHDLRGDVLEPTGYDNYPNVRPKTDDLVRRLDDVQVALDRQAPHYFAVGNQSPLEATARDLDSVPSSWGSALSGPHHRSIERQSSNPGRGGPGVRA